MTEKYLLTVDAALALVAIGLAVYAAYTLHRVGKIRSAFGDKNRPVDLEELLSVLAVKIRDLERDTETLAANANSARYHTGTTVQKVGLVRFNSFADEGGNFLTAFDGVQPRDVYELANLPIGGSLMLAERNSLREFLMAGIDIEWGK